MLERTEQSMYTMFIWRGVGMGGGLPPQDWDGLWGDGGGEGGVALWGRRR